MTDKKTLDNSILTSVVNNGDLSKLTPDQKVEYYKAFCERVGLDPVTQPFKIMRLNGREILYCDRSGTQQLSKLHSVSHVIKGREMVSGIYVVTAQASTPDGRSTESIGAANIEGLKGEALCNAFMKAETKAKRRATLDLLGVGMLDETEADSIAPAEAKIAVPIPAEKKPATDAVMESGLKVEGNKVSLPESQPKDGQKKEALTEAQQEEIKNRLVLIQEQESFEHAKAAHLATASAMRREEMYLKGINELMEFAFPEQWAAYKASVQAAKAKTS